jgi:hypothetical protein
MTFNIMTLSIMTLYAKFCILMPNFIFAMSYVLIAWPSVAMLTVMLSVVILIDDKLSDFILNVTKLRGRGKITYMFSANANVLSVSVPPDPPPPRLLVTR